MAVGEVIRLLLAVVLAAAAASKLRAQPQALATFGIRWRPVWWIVAAVEAALAVAVAIDVPRAPYAAAGLLGVFAAALAVALARGRAGAPCGCFGARSRVGPFAVARTLALAAAFAAVPSLPQTHPGAATWLAAAALAVSAGLGVVVVALAREVGELRLAVGPQSALTIAGEGPDVGVRSELIDRFERTAARTVAVFSSSGCRLCQALVPAVRLVAREPGVALEEFDEHDDADLWRTLRIPGSPFAVVMDEAGVVLAAGTFNTHAQLEGLLLMPEPAAV